MSALYKGRHRIVEVYRGMSKKAKTVTVAGVMVLGLGAGTYAASATTTVLPAGSVTAATTVANDADTGSTNAIWALDNFTRTLTVSPDAGACTGMPVGNDCYAATVSDTGSFTAKSGALTPNQSTPGTVLSSAVTGSMSGGETYLVYAPATDILDQNAVTSSHDDAGVHPSGTVYSPGDWAKQAFVVAGSSTPATDVIVEPSTDWSWTYNTACESWIDGVKDNGGLSGDGNITGLQSCTDTSTVPSVSNGRVLSVNNNRAQVTWTESTSGWPNASKCEEVWISGPGFGSWNSADPTNPGDSHVGFTCDNTSAGMNTGYLAGLEAGHLYALRIVPATGTYGNHTPIAGAAVGYVDVFTTR